MSATEFAFATTEMTHIATQQALNVKLVDWMEYVTDQEYLKKTQAKIRSRLAAAAQATQKE